MNTRALSVFTVCFSFTALLLQSAKGATSDIDSLDAQCGPDDQVEAIAVQLDGKIIFGGFLTSVQGVARTHLARLNADGTLDAGFDPRPNARIEMVAVQTDGKVLVGGPFTTLQPNGGAVYNRSYLARLNA